MAPDSLMLTLGIDAKKEGREVAACDIKGAYLNAYMKDRVVMVFEGNMVDYMVNANPNMPSMLSLTNMGRNDYTYA